MRYSTCKLRLLPDIWLGLVVYLEKSSSTQEHGHVSQGLMRDMQREDILE